MKFLKIKKRKNAQIPKYVNKNLQEEFPQKKKKQYKNNKKFNFWF